MYLRHAGPLLLFAALPAVWTYPLVFHLGTHIPGDPGDNYSFLWNFWWMRRALASADISFFHSTHLLAPDGVDLVNHPHMALQASLAATILGGFPLVVSLNLVVLLSVFLTGICTYLLAFDITRDVRAATLAGVITAGSPYMSAHMMGHFDLLSVWVLPLTALCLRRALATGRAAWMAGCGLTIAIAAYTAYYYVVYAGLLVATMVAAWCCVDRARMERRPQTAATRRAIAALITLLAIVTLLILWVAATGGAVWTVGGTRISMRAVQNPMTIAWLLVATLAALTWKSPIVLRHPSADERPILVRLLTWSLATFVLAAAPLIYYAIGNVSAGRYATQTYFWRSAIAGVDAAAFALGNPFHPWLRAVRDDPGWFDRVEGIAWLGLVPIALLLWRGRGWADRREARCWIGVLVAGAVWSLGPRLLLGGFDLGVPLPQSLARLVPIVDNARVPGRAMVLVYLAAAILCAMRLASRDARPLKPFAYVALVSLVLLDYLPAPIPLTALDRPAMFQRLAALADDKAVCPVPFGFGDGLTNNGYSGRRMLYYATLHGHPIVGGYIGRLPSAIAQEYARNATLMRLMALSEDGHELHGTDGTAPPANARELPCRYVLLDKRAAAKDLMDFVAGLKLRMIASDEEHTLYVNEPD